MNRRRFLSLAGCGLYSAASGFDQEPAADITLRIGDVTLDLAPRHSIKTLAYNGQVPGPVLRVAEGKTIAVDVFNDTADQEMVHWHGLHIPSDVDGAHEEGTPHVPPHEHRRYTFTASPAG